VTDLGRWSAAQDSGMDQACEFNVGDMARGAIYAFEVPDGQNSESAYIVQLFSGVECSSGCQTMLVECSQELLNIAIRGINTPRSWDLLWH
jgi:hypothetical protein